MGPIGTPGQSKTKTFVDAVAAKREHDTLVGEKTRKGYLLVGGAAVPAEKKAAKPKTAAPTKPVDARR